MRARTIAALCAAGAVLGVAAPARAQSTAQCAWMNASRPASERAAQLLAAMSIDDKIALTFGSGSQYGFAAQTPANDRLCIPQFVYSDGPAGVAGGFGGTQTGTTPFPVGISQAASWDVSLQTRLGAAFGQEALAKSANVLLGPAMNIGRVPTNGRNFEYFGEDPFLSGRTAVAVTQGIQSNPVVATAKHYAANNQETDRMTVSAEVGERTLREIYLPAFEATVREGRVGSVMCAYNKVNGTYACEQPDLLTRFLKSDWGFDGWVMSDWGGTHSTVPSALAGMDQEQTGFGSQYYGDALKTAVTSGKVPVSRLDDMVLRILRPAFRLGLFDRRPAPQPGAYSANASTAEHQKLALEVAEQGGVLLKNAGILPLDRIPSGTRIAVIGRAASPAGAQVAAVGSGSAHVNGTAVDPVQAITARAGSQQAVVSYSDGDSQADAAAAAAAADMAIVFVRDSASEGSDRPSLALNDGICALIFCQQFPTDEDAMIAAVAGANPNTVVVMLTGGPVTMPWLKDVKGVLEVWYPGMRYGDAVAALLFGDVNLSGKLPQSFPVAASDLPARTPEQYPGKNGKAIYSEGLQVGYRWFDAQGIEPLFAFGFGLSYTTFDLDNLRVTPGSPLDVRFDVINTGGRAGAEVGQVYVGFPSSTGEPPRQLKGFEKVFLAPGQKRTATVALDDRAFSYWDDGWRVAPGCYELALGRSSRDIVRRATVEVGQASCSGAIASIDVPVTGAEAASAIPLPANRSCFSRRRMTIRLRDPRGRERFSKVTVRINGRTRKTLAGGTLRTTLRRRGGVLVDLLGRSGRVRVQVLARTTRKRTIRRTRTYRLCVKRRGAA